MLSEKLIGKKYKSLNLLVIPDVAKVSFKSVKAIAANNVTRTNVEESFSLLWYKQKAPVPTDRDIPITPRALMIKLDICNVISNFKP